MSLLNQLFNRGVFGAKCKTSLTLAIARIKLLQNKRDMQLKLMRKEIAQFLQAGQEAIARIRVEHVIREQNLRAAYDILELFCEFIHARVPILETQRDCPSDLREAIASIIFAAPRCSDVPDFLTIRNLFTTKYGKEFVAAAAELRPDSGVNRELIETLSISAPPPEARLKVLKDITREHKLEWDSSNTEAELSKKHEDLLAGPRQLTDDRAPRPSKSPITHSSFRSSSSNGSHQIVDAVNGIESETPGGLHKTTRASKEAQTPQMYEDVVVNKMETSRPQQSSQILEKARDAIAHAVRASAAARAAAELAKIPFEACKTEVKS